MVLFRHHLPQPTQAQLMRGEFPKTLHIEQGVELSCRFVEWTVRWTSRVLWMASVTQSSENSSRQENRELPCREQHTLPLFFSINLSLALHPSPVFFLSFWSQSSYAQGLMCEKTAGVFPAHVSCWKG